MLELRLFLRVFFLHEYGNQQFEQHDHGLEQGGGFRSDFALIRKVDPMSRPIFIKIKLPKCS